MGPIVIELYWKHAPETCRNFAELARRGYYNGVKFHRIILDFMIQGGDPTGTGRGGSSIYGRTFADEIHPELKHMGNVLRTLSKRIETNFGCVANRCWNSFNGQLRSEYEWQSVLYNASAVSVAGRPSYYIRSCLQWDEDCAACWTCSMR